MKKTYINPEMEIVKIQTMQMLAASDTQLNINGTPVDDGTPGEGREFDFDEY